MHIQQFSDNIIHAVQQNNARLDGTVMRKESLRAEAFYFNKLGAFELEQKIGRNSTTPFLDPIHSRRKLVTNPFHQGIAIDSFDQSRTNITIQPEYVKGLMKAINRKKDQIIIEASTGVAYEGKDGTTAVSFPSSQRVAVGATGLTTDKLLAGLEILRGNDVDPDEKIYCAITAKQEIELFAQDKIINADFSKYAVLDKGIIGAWMNINFIRTEKLQVVDGDTEVLMYTENALGLGMLGSPIVKIAENPERSFTPTVYVHIDLGATRVEDEKIVAIACNI